jgi:hypothetical protein
MSTAPAPSPTSKLEPLKVLAFVLLFTWFPIQAMHYANVSDPDIWWHMRTGEWIFQQHAIPHADPFSISGQPWVAYSWLFDAFIYQIAQHWDLVGIVAYTVAMWLAITGFLFRLVRSLLPNFWLSSAITLAATLAMSRIFGPRPGLFTTLFFILTLHTLLAAERTGDTRKLWLLPLIMIVWANMHIQFVYGLFLIGVFAIEPLFARIFRNRVASRGSSRTLWLVLAASIVATLCNPYGAGIYGVLWDFFRQPKLYSLVIETQPMKFNHFTHYLAVALALVAAISLAYPYRRGSADRLASIRGRNLRPAWIILLIWATASGIHAERDVWVIAIIAAAAIALSLQQSSEPAILATRTRNIAIGCVMAIILLGLTWIMPTNQQLLARVARVYPVGAVAYIHEHHLQGPIFNDFNWGGFLIYALPETPVTIDGRTNVHGQVRIENSWNSWNLGPNWEHDPNFVAANLVIAEPQLALAKALKGDPHYQLAFNDGVSLLFVRVRQ